MIAAEYGYEVLPGVALDTPGVENILRRRERALRWGLVALTVEVLLLAAVLSLAGPGSAPGLATAACVTPVITVTTGLTLLWRRARRQERLVMSTYGWQIWPVRTQDVRIVAADGERARGRRWGTGKQVVLLQPDGQSHCSFPIPADGWDDPRPQGPRTADRVWFAGDTRFGGIVAEPGGQPFRYVARSTPGKRPGTGPEDELAHRASLMPGNRQR
jgi:hypothetical protein